MGINNITIVIRGVSKLRKIRKQSFEELVLENKKQLLKDQEAMDKIEARLEQKMLGKAE
jgi:hypothetical protein